MSLSEETSSAVNGPGRTARAIRTLADGVIQGELPAGRAIVSPRPPLRSPYARRVILNRDPYADRFASQNQWTRGHWPAHWIIPATPALSPQAHEFRLRFDVTHPTTTRIHVCADERFELFLDGLRVGRGPDHGDANNTFFISYEIDLAAGKHELLAWVWHFGDAAPFAKMSGGLAFILGGEGALESTLCTGVADWNTRPIAGFETLPPQFFGHARFVGLRHRYHAATFTPRPDSSHAGDDESPWTSAAKLAVGQAGYPSDLYSCRRLRPTLLPEPVCSLVGSPVVRFAQSSPRAESAENTFAGACHRASNDATIQRAFQSLLVDGRPTRVDRRTNLRVVVDLADYFCVYPHLRIVGGTGASVRVGFAESLYETPGNENSPKGHRDRVSGKFFMGNFDEFVLDGSDAAFTTFHFQAGRFVQIEIVTADSPLTIERLDFEQTHHHFDFEDELTLDDRALADVMKICRRTLQIGTHDGFTDSPYFEQLSYVGDSRLDALLSFVTCRDDAMPRKTVELFAASQLPNGFTQSRYPCRVAQVIPTFSMLWVGMLHDAVTWRPAQPWMRPLLRVARGVVDAILEHRNADGLIERLPVWAFMDWARGFADGVAPGSHDGVNGSVNWLAVNCLSWMRDLERVCGDADLAERYERIAADLAAATHATFWNDDERLYIESPKHALRSEHAQALAAMSNRLDESTRQAVADVLERRDAALAPASVYFTHYVFEAFRILRRTRPIFDRLSLWHDLPKLGMKCTPEQPEPTRSDAHAWGAHPMFHLHTTIAGIRPGATEFASIDVSPRLGTLKNLATSMPHPAGMIRFSADRREDEVDLSIELPAGVPGVLRLRNDTISLATAGRPQRFVLPADEVDAF